MCGLVGYTGREGAKADPQIIQKLMMANDSRGGHSSGYYDGAGFKKCLGRSNNLHSEMRGITTNTFIGHTRFSTHGETNIPNQHPFKFGNVIGAHNGVVHNYKEVGEKYQLSKTEVDSQMIFKVMNHTQHLDILGLFSGALATLFQKDGVYYTYRKTNPLWVGRDGKGGVYFSSLRDVLIGCNLVEVFQLKESRVYVWEGDEIVARIDVDSCPIEQKYQSVKKQWFEYGDDTTPIKTYSNMGHKPYKGITDLYDDQESIDDIDITDYDLTESQEQLELFESNRCNCQDGNDGICWCVS